MKKKENQNTYIEIELYHILKIIRSKNLRIPRKDIEKKLKEIDKTGTLLELYQENIKINNALNRIDDIQLRALEMIKKKIDIETAQLMFFYGPTNEEEGPDSNTKKKRNPP